MLNTFKHCLVVVVLTVLSTACSSPEEKAAAYLENAVSLFEGGNLTSAEIEYKNALQINQNLPDAWYGLAKIYERKQEWRDAYAVLNKIRELAPQHIEGRMMLAQILLGSNQLDQALTDAREILDLAPGDARSHSLMAAVHFRLGNYEGARHEISKTFAIDSGNSDALLVQARVLIAEKKYREALKILDTEISNTPNNVSHYLMQIQAYQELDDDKSIEAVYLELADRFPGNIAFKEALARYYIRIKDIDKAERMLALISEIDSAGINEKLRLVRFKYQYRSLDEAVSLLKKYITVDSEEPRYQFALAEFYEKENQTSLAKDVYKEVIDVQALKSDGLEARNKIALIEMRAGNREKAEKLVSEVLTHDNANEGGLLIQAGFHMLDHEYDDVVLNLRTVLRDHPKSMKALGLLGQAYDAIGSSELAIESYAKAFQLDPGAPIIANRFAGSLVQQQKFSQADEVISESMSRGNRSIDAIRLLTQIKLSLREWDNAEQLARQLQKIEGQEAISQQVLGLVYQGRDEQSASVDAFKRAHELAPSSSQPIVALVRSYVRRDKVKEARQFLNSVLSVHSENMTAYMLLGQLSLYEKDTDGAISSFNKVIEIDPKASEGYRGLISIFLRDNKLDNAEATALNGLKALPDHPALTMSLASIYEKKQQFEKAITIYESMISKDSNLIIATNNLASLLTDYRQDQTSFERARSLSAELKTSKVPQFRDTYAWAVVKSGTNLKEAIVILEQIVKEYDHIGVFNYHLGEAYLKSGQNQNAALFLGKAAKQAGPDSELGKMAQQSLKLIN